MIASVKQPINNNNAQLLIYTNAAGDKLEIKYGKEVILAIEIFNVLGEKVITVKQAERSKEQGVVVDIRALSPSLYFIKVATENGNVVEKFIKE